MSETQAEDREARLVASQQARMATREQLFNQPLPEKDVPIKDPNTGEVQFVVRIRARSVTRMTEIAKEAKTLGNEDLAGFIAAFDAIIDPQVEAADLSPYLNGPAHIPMALTDALSKLHGVVEEKAQDFGNPAEKE